MIDWWQTEVVDTGKQPLALCAIAFLVTFAVTRLIVRSIRAGKGSLKDNVVGGVHVHHAVPGIVLMVVFGLVALGTEALGWRSVAGVGFGIGLALVLDEFALILHLEDVYWSEEGRTSVDAVLLLAGVLVLVLLGATPANLGDPEVTGADSTTGLLLAVGLNLLLVAVCFVKGKLGTGVIGVVVPLVALVGAVRTARPRSPWAHRRYRDGSPELARAEDREARFDRRWRSKVRGFQDRVAGFAD